MLRLALPLVAVVSLSGCVTKQALQFSHGDLELSATRSGCAIRNFTITNSGAIEKTASGEINVLDSAKSNELTVRYSCPTVYPGGRSECTSYVTSASSGSSGGPGCPGYKEYRNKMNAY